MRLKEPHLNPVWEEAAESDSFRLEHALTILLSDHVVRSLLEDGDKSARFDGPDTRLW